MLLRGIVVRIDSKVVFVARNVVLFLQIIEHFARNGIWFTRLAGVRASGEVLANVMHGIPGYNERNKNNSSEDNDKIYGVNNNRVGFDDESAGLVAKFEETVVLLRNAKR